VVFKGKNKKVYNKQSRFVDLLQRIISHSFLI